MSKLYRCTHSLQLLHAIGEPCERQMTVVIYGTNS